MKGSPIPTTRQVLDALYDNQDLVCIGGPKLNHRSVDSPTARRAFQFCVQTRRPTPKSAVSQMTSWVRSARPSLKYCLIREDL